MMPRRTSSKEWMSTSGDGGEAGRSFRIGEAGRVVRAPSCTDAFRRRGEKGLVAFGVASGRGVSGTVSTCISPLPHASGSGFSGWGAGISDSSHGALFFASFRAFFTTPKMIKPNIRFVGSEYKGTHHTGWDIPGIDIFYNRRDHDYSTTELRERVYEREKEKKENS